ncbi:hypothetical protein [Streptomyces sp. NBC_00989]|uniref:hypothetical protein n=1 Tax=Streptomyces sp. NBC_00989 TaxID=2903705 RepID=UPI00386893A6|nr:hypothetical protein OG714_35385 [Streptomyces sp. NBC_00989]
MLAFRNGDTLENIPVIRADPPRRFPWKATTAGGTVAIVVGVRTALLLRHPAGRDASLLMNAPGYQCGADLVGAHGLAIQADGSSVFQASPPVCADSYPDTRMTYPAVLDFPHDGGAQPPAYVCVPANVGS